MFKGLFALAAAVTVFGATATLAQTPQPASTTAPPAPAAASKTPDSLSVYFASGNAAISPEGQAVLDHAARIYRDGKPIIMVVSGGCDATGPAASNLHLSQVRAENVLQGLVARGIPIERFQVLAKGETEPPVPDAEGKAEPRNRRVEISWR